MQTISNAQGWQYSAMLFIHFIDRKKKAYEMLQLVQASGAPTVQR